jgi:hypothetical protein
MIFGIGGLHNPLSSKAEFHENRLSDSHTLSEGPNEFLHVNAVLIDKFG